MEKQDAKNIIVEILQKVLAGQLKQESTLNPTSLAEAIMQKVNFLVLLQNLKINKFL